MLKKFLSVFLSLSMVVSSIALLPGAAFAESSGPDLNTVRGAAYLRANTGTEGIDTFYYSDELFKENSLKYSEQLATTTLDLAASSLATARESEYAKKHRNLISFLEDTGFTDFEANEDFMVESASPDSAATACAYKHIRDNGKDYTLLALVPRSGTFGAEFEYDFYISGSPEDHGDMHDFIARRDTILSFAKSYIKNHGITGDIKVWTTGFSRGAGIVNLVGAQLLDDPEGSLGSSVTLRPEDLYCYTFGTPSPVDGSKDYSNSRYDYIHNIFGNGDLIAKAPPVSFGLKRYGTVTELLIPENKERMLNMMKDLSLKDYYNYLENDPDDYYPLKLDTKALKSGELGFIKDDDSYLPYSLPEYCDSITATLSDLSARSSSSGDSREGYFMDYQTPAMHLGRYLVGDLYGGDKRLIESVKNNKKLIPMVFTMYLTFLTDKHLNDSTSAINDNIEGAFNYFAYLAENQDGTLKKDFKKLSSSYYKLRDLCFYTDDDPEIKEEIPQKYKLIHDVSYIARNKTLRGLVTNAVRKLNADLYASIMYDALTECGYGQDAIEDLTSSEDSMSMSLLLATLAFGNSCQSKTLKPFSLNSEQFKSLATFAGNIKKTTIEHSGFPFRNWLKTHDPNYDNFVPLTAADNAGYRRVYIKGENISGTVTDASGSVAATFEDGVLTFSNNEWIRITTCDTGNWLRLPIDSEYKVILNAGSTGRVSIRAAEYDVFEGAVVRTISSDSKHDWTAIDAAAGDEITLDLPEIKAEGGEYSLPSDAEYSLSIAEDPSHASSWIIAKAVSDKKGKVTVSWTGSGDADRYVVSLRQKGSGSKSFKTVSGKTQSCVMKGLKKGKVYKFTVAAQKAAGSSYRTISESKAGYVITANVKGKYTNPKAIRLNLSFAKLNKGDKFKLKAKVTKVRSGKKLLTYTSAVRYLTTDKNVAAVNSKGEIKAVGKGSCHICAQAVNGVWKRVKVTVY